MSAHDHAYHVLVMQRRTHVGCRGFVCDKGASLAEIQPEADVPGCELSGAGHGDGAEPKERHHRLPPLRYGRQDHQDAVAAFDASLRQGRCQASRSVHNLTESQITRCPSLVHPQQSALGLIPCPAIQHVRGKVEKLRHLRTKGLSLKRRRGHGRLRCAIVNGERPGIRRRAPVPAPVAPWPDPARPEIPAASGPASCVHQQSARSRWRSRSNADSASARWGTRPPSYSRS